MWHTRCKGGHQKGSAALLALYSLVKATNNKAAILLIQMKRKGDDATVYKQCMQRIQRHVDLNMENEASVNR